MVRIYFLGGEDINKRTSKTINKRAFKDANAAPAVLVFPWTRRVEKTGYRKIMSDYFTDLGAGKVMFGELVDSFEKLEGKVQSSDIVYLPGGDPDILMKRIRKKGVDSLLNRYKRVIIGNSAGSLLLCKKYVVIRGQGESSKTRLIQGLGIVDFGVTVHYKSAVEHYSGNEPDKELKALSKRTSMKIYAIPERGALVYDGKSLKPIGGIYLFYEGRKTKYA